MTTNKLTAAVVAAMVASVAMADKVTLKSGSTLTGEADVIRDGKLTFKSDDLGEIKIDITKITSLESDRDHVVKYNDNHEETLKVTVVNGALAVAENGDFSTLDMGNVKATDPVAETWHGSVNLSGTVTRGNTVAETATVEAEANRRWEKDRVSLKGGYYFAESGDSRENKQKTTSRLELQGQEDHFWSSKFYSYANGKYEFDRINNLKYRYRFGLGLGYQWLENVDFGLGKTSFNQEVGGTYIFEKYDHTDKDEYGTFRYAHHYTWAIGAIDGLNFTHNFEYLPQVDDWAGNYMIDTDVGLTYDFSANWQLVGKAEWDYKRKVGAGTKHSDIRYILGIGYKW